ncbi:MAG: nucleotidyltransferase domain-containing protein, partial [Candidatus Omnitrophica bacterium]|nr:nucleotidyltransferase domain-containing protein [Candidatus Omnitrophota bacterium]
MKSLYKILAEENEKNLKKYFKNYLLYGEKIKKRAKKLFSDAEILLFGSLVRGDYRADSDIDVLVISSRIPKELFKQSQIKLKLKEGFEDAPFQIHLATLEEYENWYKKFIKRDY